MTDRDLSTFAILNSITGSLSLNDNNLTHLDGLTNLISVGGYLHLQRNRIINVSGLNALMRVGGVLDISYNDLRDLNGLNTLKTVKESIKIYHNPKLTDIFGLSGVSGYDGQKIYIDNTEYSHKADSTDRLCASRWDIYDTTGNIADDMRKLCEGYTRVQNDADRLRDLLGKRCAIDSFTFYGHFEESSGIYNGDIYCNGLTEEDMNGFAGLREVNGDFAIEQSEITTLEALIRLKKVTGTLSIRNNRNLRDIHGLSNISAVEGQKLIIDDPVQYEVKADATSGFCSVKWDIRIDVADGADDMTTVCAP